jgi:glutamate-ammonia-ligase adenylyltransferase
VATSLAAFEAYQREEAWAWEHMALTRAHCVAGAREVCAEAEAVRAAVLAEPREPAAVWADLAKMRARLEEAKPPRGPLDVKPGRGGLQEIELVAQAAALLVGASARRTAAQLDAAARAGLIAKETAETLRATYRFARSVQSVGRLLVDGPLVPEKLGQGARAVLLRETETESLEALERALTERRAAAARLIDGLLESAGAGAPDDEAGR